MSGLFQFLMDNAALVGGLAFIGMLLSVGTKTERIMLFFVGGSIFAFLATGSIEVVLGLLALGGVLLLADRLRTA